MSRGTRPPSTRWINDRANQDRGDLLADVLHHVEHHDVVIYRVDGVVSMTDTAIMQTCDCCGVEDTRMFLHFNCPFKLCKGCNEHYSDVRNSVDLVLIEILRRRREAGEEVPEVPPRKQ